MAYSTVNSEQSLEANLYYRSICLFLFVVSRLNQSTSNVLLELSRMKFVYETRSFSAYAIMYE